MKTTTLLSITALLFALAACSQQSGAGADDTAAPAKPPTASVEADSSDCLTDPPPEPVMCTADWRPVCGCDGKTYSNACNAKAAGVTRHTPGECGEGEAR